MDSKGDVGAMEDLFFGIKNLVALEDHCKTSYYITKSKKWQELGDYARKVRTRWMQKFVKLDDGHLWCSTKHIASIIMSSQESANRCYSANDIKGAEEFEEEAKVFSGMAFLLNQLEGGKK